MRKHPINPTFKSEFLPIAMLVLALISSFYFRANFPSEVPTHWNAAGMPDNWSSSGFAAFFFPVLMLGIYLLMLFLPYLDPQRDRYHEFRLAYHWIKFYLVFFMLVLYFLTAFSGLGFPVSIALWVPVLVGGLFILVGWHLPSLKYNWFVGIRTPWTLSSEQVWDKTHQVAGKLFIICGAVLILEPALPVSWRMPVLFLMIAALIFGTMGYSYVVYRKENSK
jgi:uncharacterized membrane protein